MLNLGASFGDSQGVLALRPIGGRRWVVPTGVTGGEEPPTRRRVKSGLEVGVDRGVLDGVVGGVTKAEDQGCSLFAFFGAVLECVVAGCWRDVNAVARVACDLLNLR
jgi:hypothetical protein